MKITLITPTPPDISAFGIRILSAVLKQASHHVSVIFLPGGIGKLDVDGHYVYRYPQRLLDEISHFCSSSDLVGISFMSQYYDRAAQITAALKRSSATAVVWGGIHPTLCPDQCLSHADYVVEGEGEMPLLKLVQFLEGEIPWEEVPNTWRHGKRGALQSPTQYVRVNDVTTLPAFDHDISTHYVAPEGAFRLLPLTEELLRRILPKMPHFQGKYLTVYRTMTTRGCPHRCTYCVNRTLQDKYGVKHYLRRRTMTQVVEEIEQIITRFPFIGGVHFFDDSFFSYPIKQLETFASLYGEKIALPFYCQGSPESITEQKMELLIEAGMVFCEMGIQSGSEKIARMYGRSASNERILGSIRIIDRYRERLLKPHYHIIVDNPWEGSEDALKTIELLLQIPHPFMLCLASLTLFPGTELHRKAMAEKIIKDPIKDVFRKAFYKPRPSYLNFIIILTDHYYLPRLILRTLVMWPLVSLFQRRRFNKVWAIAIALDSWVRLLFKAFSSIRYGNLWRIRQFIQGSKFKMKKTEVSM